MDLTLLSLSIKVFEFEYEFSLLFLLIDKHWLLLFSSPALVIVAYMNFFGRSIGSSTGCGIHV